MGKYDDIIHLPHHVSDKRPQMPMRSRAAQFAPFAALTGYDAAIRETARQTQSRIELDESARTRLDARLQILRDQLETEPAVVITSFVPDGKKAGGAYVDTVGVVSRIDSYERRIIMADGTEIAIDDICDITGELFGILE